MATILTIQFQAVIPPTINDGYTSGGYAAGFATSNVIDSFPMTAPFASATDVGDLSAARGDMVGNSSSTHGYTSGSNAVDRYSFTSPFTTATDVGDLSPASRRQSSSQDSDTNGYVSGGWGPGTLNSIVTFPFSAAPFGTATTHGTLTSSRIYTAGQSSDTDGYVSGGGPSITATIMRFPFGASPVSSTNVGNLSESRQQAAGLSSDTDGYTAGGTSPPFRDTIDSFPFSSPFSTATDVGNLSQLMIQQAGQSGSTDGYVSGGRASTSPPNIGINNIYSFPFSSPFTTTSDVGDLTVNRFASAGQEG